MKRERTLIEMAVQAYLNGLVEANAEAWQERSRAVLLPNLLTLEESFGLETGTEVAQAVGSRAYSAASCPASSSPLAAGRCARSP